MEFPIRCFTCGAVIGHLYEKYAERTKNEERGKVLDELGVKRYCCRRMFISHVDTLPHVLRYQRV